MIITGLKQMFRENVLRGRREACEIGRSWPIIGFLVWTSRWFSTSGVKGRLQGQKS